MRQNSRSDLCVNTHACVSYTDAGNAFEADALWQSLVGSSGKSRCGDRGMRSFDRLPGCLVAEAGEFFVPGPRPRVQLALAANQGENGSFQARPATPSAQAGDRMG